MCPENFGFVEFEAIQIPQEPLEASPGTIRIIHKMFQGSQPGLKIIVENITKINPNF